MSESVSPSVSESASPSASPSSSPSAAAGGRWKVWNGSAWDVVPDLDGYVPYTGADTAVDLGAQNLTTTGKITSTTDGIVFPSADPHIAGAWWNDSGVLTESAG